MSDDGEIDVEAAIAVGSKVIEMADRVHRMGKLVPGGEAVWGFEMDDVTYEVRLKEVAP